MRRGCRRSELAKRAEEHLRAWWYPHLFEEFGFNYRVLSTVTTSMPLFETGNMRNPRVPSLHVKTRRAGLRSRRKKIPLAITPSPNSTRMTEKVPKSAAVNPPLRHSVSGCAISPPRTSVVGITPPCAKAPGLGNSASNIRIATSMRANRRATCGHLRRRSRHRRAETRGRHLFRSFPYGPMTS